MLFKRPDAHTGKEIFSGYSSCSHVKTYENNYWYSDGWDKLETGLEYDFGRPFFEQFKNLLHTAPIPARSVFNMINSDYANEASECKNVYLSFNLDYIENSGYLRKIRIAKDSFDCYECENMELSYESSVCNTCYRTFYSLECDNCVDVYFSKNLRGCTNCFGCVNLRNKSYHFFNEPYSKEEYDRKVAQYLTGKFSDILKMKEQVYEF